MRILKVFLALALSSWGYLWFCCKFHSTLFETIKFKLDKRWTCVVLCRREWNWQKNHQYPQEDNASAKKTFTILMIKVTIVFSLSLLPWGYWRVFLHLHYPHEDIDVFVVNVIPAYIKQHFFIVFCNFEWSPKMNPKSLRQGPVPQHQPKIYQKWIDICSKIR